MLKYIYLLHILYIAYIGYISITQKRGGNMDHRKLMGFSKGSYIVTMPKSWIVKNNLKKGDTISIEEGNNELIFYAGQKEPIRKEKAISIETEGKKLAIIKAEIVSAYLNNCNTIEIRSKNLADDAPVIKGIIRNLSGMEIIEQTGTKIVAQDLIDVSSISIQNIMRRMDVITRSMIDDLLLCIGGKCDPKSIINRDTDVNRLYFLGYRVIKNAMENPAVMRELNINIWHIANHRSVLIRVEEIADTQKRISRLLSNAQLRGETLEGIREITEDIKNSYNDVMKAYYTNDKKIALEIEINHENLIEKCNKFLENASKSSSLEIRDSRQPQVLYKENIVIANIVEFKKSALSYIRRIARIVLSAD